MSLGNAQSSVHETGPSSRLHEPVIVHSGRKEMSPSQSSMSSPCVSWWATLLSESTQTMRWLGLGLG